MNRRQMLKTGVVLGTAVGAEPAISALLSDAGLAAAFLADTRYPESLAAAGAPSFRRLRQLRTDGDVTRLWYDRLDREWRETDDGLAGVTGADVLFVLETLARDRGRRLIDRAPLGNGAVRWLIGKAR